MRKRSVEKDVVVLILLVVVVFGLVSFIKDTTITGRTVEPINQPPAWTGDTSFTLTKNDFLVINLDSYFTDPDGDTLTYLAAIASNVNAEVSGTQLKLTPDADFVGERLISVFASDGQETTKQVIIVEVLETPPEPEQPEPATVNDAIKDQNGRSVGKKIEEDYTFDTIMDSVERTSQEIIITFHHNANDELPVWIEGWADYTLSKTTALPGEIITLKVLLVDGIVPKFKLHVGETSDVFEFGKTIPAVTIVDDMLNSGQYGVYDRDDDYVDVELIKGDSRVVLNAVDAEEINARIGKIEELQTEVVAIDPIALGGATVTLEKTGDVSVIRMCEDFSTETFTCQGEWEITDIPFTDMGDVIVFTVTHFSAYAGGAATHLVIWDDSDLGTQFTGVPMMFYANFTNATGPANTTNGACQIRFNTTGAWSVWNSMTFDGATLKYWYSTTFGTQGTPYYYEVNCTGTGENLAAVDTFYVYQFIPSQGLFSCTFRTGIPCLPGETKVLGVSATTNAHAELPNQSLYNTSICCQDLSGRNTILTTGPAFINLSNITNAHVALPNSSVPYAYPANISGSNDTLTCTYIHDPTAPGVCQHPQGCLATISNDTNAHVADCTSNPYNWTICCGFAAVPLNSTINISKNVSPSPAIIGHQITYTITYQNLGPGTATNIVINETYPNGTSFVSSNPPPSVGNNVWNISNLTAGQNGTIVITLLVTSSVANGTYLNNTVNITWLNASGGVLRNSANASVLALTGPAPTPRRQGGWPATEGARQYYEKLAEEGPKTAGCHETWHCTEWSECIGGLKTRTCTDRNNCTTEIYKPDEVTTCAIEQPELPAVGQAIEYPELPPPPAPMPAMPEEPVVKENQWALILPFFTYGFVILLVIVLLVYLIREHFMGKKTHDAWYYMLYVLLALSVLSVIAEAALAKQLHYPAIFAIAAIIMVFVLDTILRMLPKTPPSAKLPPKPPKAAVHPAKRKTKEISKDELEELSRKLKELNV